MTTLFLSVDPALFLVVLALVLFGLALAWSLLLARLLLLDLLQIRTRPPRCPVLKPK